MDTDEIMALSLDLAKLDRIPEDSAIYVSGRNISKILFGIDAGAAELLLARQMGFDAVVAHHPMASSAITNFHEVFRRHVPQMVAEGIPEAEAKRVVAKKLKQLKDDGHRRNYGHAADVAKQLKMPYMNIHTPLDEVGRQIMTDQIGRRVDTKGTVRDVVSALNEIGEFKNALTEIEIRVGEAESTAGKIVVSHGAGTNGGYDIAKAYYSHGVGTVIYIHIGSIDLERLTSEKLGNLIITGHVSSDSVGINPFLDALRRKGLSVSTIGVVSP